MTYVVAQHGGISARGLHGEAHVAAMERLLSKEIQEAGG